MSAEATSLLDLEQSGVRLLTPTCHLLQKHTKILVHVLPISVPTSLTLCVRT